MTDSVFDIALQKRFDEAPLIPAIEVTSNDTLLIRDLETGVIMRMPVSVLYSALGSAFASLIDGKVPASQLPSYVDDVLEYANLAAFPGTGESGKIYVALDTNKTYRWSGSAYVEISASLALGETSSTAYRGDRGKTAYDHSQTTGNPHSTTKADVGLSNVDNTSDTNKPVSTVQQTALDAKQATSAKGAANGYAGLDASGFVPSNQNKFYKETATRTLNSSMGSIDWFSIALGSFQGRAIKVSVVFNLSSGSGGSRVWYRESLILESGGATLSEQNLHSITAGNGSLSFILSGSNLIVRVATSIATDESARIAIEIAGYGITASNVTVA